MNNMRIDYDCEHCQEVMKEAVSSFNRNEPFTITLRPDFNADGNVTHWHIDKPKKSEI